ncbi:MAG: amidohydrolase family protein, partial [Candidatus Binataceae bacterium]
MSSLSKTLFLVVCMLVSGLCAAAIAQETQQTPDNTVPFTTTVDPSSTTLFENVRIFDGKKGTISPSSNVLVKGNVIARISAAPITVDKTQNATVVAGGGRVLMPGLIDAHWHAMMAAVPMQVLMVADIGYINLLAGKEAEATLMRGFTTVRDMGGPTFGLKRAIDQGAIAGPRIYPSGAFISQTGGHGDFRMPYEIPRTIGEPLSHFEKMGVTAIADGQDEVLL